MTMTGLPQSVVKQKQQKQSSEMGLKFKMKKQEMMETQSVLSSTTTISNSINQFSDKQLVHDNQTLTSELMVHTQNLNKCKLDLKKSQDSNKKLEKDLHELQKLMESKENAIEKLRKDRDDLWAMVNTDKYKNFKSFDEEKQKLEQRINSIQDLYEEAKTKLQKEQSARNESDGKMNGLTSQIDELQQADQSSKLLLMQLRDQNDKYLNQITKSEHLQKQTGELLEQLKNENDRLKGDVTWLANSAKNSKMQSEKAIQDLEEYNKILKMMDSKLKQTEHERDLNKKECIELQNCLNQLISQMNPQRAAATSNSQGPSPQQNFSRTQNPQQQSQMINHKQQQQFQTMNMNNMAAAQMQQPQFGQPPQPQPHPQLPMAEPQPQPSPYPMKQPQMQQRDFVGQMQHPSQQQMMQQQHQKQAQQFNNQHQQNNMNMMMQQQQHHYHGKK